MRLTVPVTVLGVLAIGLAPAASAASAASAALEAAPVSRAGTVRIGGLVLAAPSAFFSADFEDGVLDAGWTLERGFWEETGGSMNGVPDDLIGTQIKARAIADGAFAGCDSCRVSARLEAENPSGGPAENHVRLLGWFEDKQNNVSVTLKPDQDKFVFRQKVDADSVVRDDVPFSLDADVAYDLDIYFNNSSYWVAIDGEIMHHADAVIPGIIPFGTIGVQSRSTDIKLHEVEVDEGPLFSCIVTMESGGCPNTVEVCDATFTGGFGCLFENKLACYGDGIMSYKVNPGDTLTITFSAEFLAEDLLTLDVFFAADGADPGEMTFFDEDGLEITTIETNGDCNLAMPAMQRIDLTRPARSIQVTPGVNAVYIDSFHINPNVD